MVTIAEVEEIKREIACHGDTINTAARIQPKSNELEAKLLVSEHLLNFLPQNSPYQSEEKGTFELKDKAESIALYSILSIA